LCPRSLARHSDCICKTATNRSRSLAGRHRRKFEYQCTRIIDRFSQTRTCVRAVALCASLSPQAKKIDNLTLSRCQGLSEGVGARRRHFERHLFLPWKRALAQPGGHWPGHPQRTTTQRPEDCAAHNEWCSGQRTGHLDQASATHDVRRRGQRPTPMPGNTHVPFHDMRPAFDIF